MSDRVRFDGSRFGERLIRKDARVLWRRAWYRLVDGPTPLDEYAKVTLVPRSHSPLPRYDGRLDGLRGLFYTYGDISTKGNTALEGRIWLHSIVGAEWPGPACVNGVFCWETFAKEAK